MKNRNDRPARSRNVKYPHFRRMPKPTLGSLLLALHFVTGNVRYVFGGGFNTEISELASQVPLIDEETLDHLYEAIDDGANLLGWLRDEIGIELQKQRGDDDDDFLNKL